MSKSETLRAGAARPRWRLSHPHTLTEAEQVLTEARAWVASARESSETRLRFSREGRGLHLHFHGWLDAELLDEVLRLVASKALAPHVRGLRLSGEDEGTNGTRAWDLSALGRGAPLERLEALEVEGNRPGAHHRTLLGNALYQEKGVVARILARAPRLRRLSIPSAPGPAFVRGEPHPLRELVLQSGFDTQRFISRLAQSQRFGRLEALDFTDYAETYAEDFEARRTRVEDFEALFASRALPRLRRLTLRGTVLGKADVKRLRAMPLGARLERLALKP